MNKVEEAKEKIMWYGKRWTEINALNHVWFYMQYGFQYGEEQEVNIRINKMYRSAKMFFTLSRLSMERISRLELIKLFEGKDRGTMLYLRTYLHNNADELFDDVEYSNALIELNKEYESNMKPFIKTINALKDIRNNHIAHNDISLVNDSNFIHDLYEQSDIKIDEIFKIINITKEYLTDVSSLFGLHGVCIEYPETMDITSLEMRFD